MNKKALRKEMMATLSSMKPADKQEREEILKSRLLDLIESQGIQSLGIVLSMPHEMDTDGIIDHLTLQGKLVYTPVCNYENKQMEFRRFTSFDKVTKDEKNLRIPEYTEDVNNHPEMIVVPGLIYSQDGYRIGYGGGYYDRFLSHYDGLKVSLLFEEQLGEVIPENHDIPVDLLITPERTIDAEAERKRNV
ncbi:5-formyltetrahydrofolate cyclo-ligase [Salinicoccus sp. ID82-1]|uniref:5-formyltetrahydrofolate cyclo-ligase n=1 Tax=Salinicoccus sp. ID82-1 TaxID=2820269 RepID=UPI001F023942|nr:5-formyltetrahydrofolate cyclo-ligase [Salinicoccus sp. ID82-1]MCG1009008.1 5-formyltetrahydrofolate cyclo-ligase [Salinicoccus sp. ID82-1]